MQRDGRGAGDRGCFFGYWLLLILMICTMMSMEQIAVNLLGFIVSAYANRIATGTPAPSPSMISLGSLITGLSS